MLALPAIERAPIGDVDLACYTCNSAWALWILERADHIEAIEKSLREKVVAPHHHGFEEDIMEYRNVGASGLKVSLAGLGCNNFGRRCDQTQTSAVVAKALDSGINFFDTADIYGPGGLSEEYLGRALAGERQRAVIATKFAGPMGEGPNTSGASRKHIFDAVEASLRRLDTDYIDLYQVHFPDASTPLSETLRALDDLVRAGKVRYIGCSNFAGWQIADAAWLSRVGNLSPFISAQNQYNLLERRVEREVIPACTAFGLGLLPYFPLASGFLSGKYRAGEAPPDGTRLAGAGPMADRVLNEANFAALSALEGFASERGHTVLELAFSWLAGHASVPSVIAGATKPEQVEANARAVEWKLTPAEMADVDALTKKAA